jgi:hypothetical protein
MLTMPCAAKSPTLVGHFPSFTFLQCLNPPSADFHIFQYFLSVVSTTYIDARRRVLPTNQYSVTEMSRTTEHGRGVPGSSCFSSNRP